MLSTGSNAVFSSGIITLLLFADIPSSLLVVMIEKMILKSQLEEDNIFFSPKKKASVLIHKFSLAKYRILCYKGHLKLNAADLTI